MSALPDELWRQILHFGIQKSQFNYKDLCCISITCRRLHRLSCEDSLWSNLLSSDFPPPQPPQNPNTTISHPRSTSLLSAKSTYRTRFEKEKERKVAAHNRAVLRKESQILEHERRMKEFEVRLGQETEKIKETAAQLSNLHKARQASVALNVWQPEVIRGRQRQIVEQHAVPVESRFHSLEMELKLCRQQIAVYKKAHREERQRLQMAKEELKSMKYHPLQDYHSTSNWGNEDSKVKKKMKRCVNSKDF